MSVNISVQPKVTTYNNNVPNKENLYKREKQWNKVRSTKIKLSNHQPQIINQSTNKDGASTNKSDKSHPVHKRQIHVQ